MDDDELLQNAMVVARGSGRLARRLHAQRLSQSAAPMQPAPMQPAPMQPAPMQPAPMQLSVLAHLSQRGPMAPSDLATAERVQPQSLTRTLTSLEAEGLVSRQPDSTDGRRSLLAITPAGSQALFQVMGERNRWLAHAMGEQLTPTECQLLRLAAGLLERLAESDDVAVAPA